MGTEAMNGFGIAAHANPNAVRPLIPNPLHNFQSIAPDGLLHLTGPVRANTGVL